MEIVNIEVLDKIDKKDLKVFIKNSLILNDKLYEENDKIFAFYIEEILSYQIIIVPSKYEYLLAEIFSLNYKNSHKKDSFDLYLYDDFFCIYKNASLYYVQKIDYDININELISYINSQLKLTINTYKKIKSDELELLKKDFLASLTKTKLININKKSNNAFKIYILYLFVLIGISYFYFNMDNNIPSTSTNMTVNNSSKIKELKKKYLYKYFDEELSLLLINVKKYKLVLKQIDYRNKKFEMVLSSKEKEDLYSFLKEYKKKLLSNSISYIEISKIYECVLNVKAIR